MGFKDLNSTQIVAFILGVVFSLLAVAAIFWAFKYAGKIKSKVRVALYTMILPFIAITSWLILIFTFVDGFKQDEILNIFVSIAISLVICFMIITIAYVLYQKHKDTLVEEEEEQVEEVVAPIQEETVVETEVATEEQTANEEEVVVKEEEVEQPVETETTEEEVEETTEVENVEKEPVEETNEEVTEEADNLENDEEEANDELIIEEPIDTTDDTDAE